MYMVYGFLKDLQQITKLLWTSLHCLFHSHPSSNLCCNQHQCCSKLNMYCLISSTVGTKDWQRPSEEPAVGWVSKPHCGSGSQEQTTEGARDQLCQELQVFPQGVRKNHRERQIRVEGKSTSCNKTNVKCVLLKLNLNEIHWVVWLLVPQWFNSYVCNAIYVSVS